MKSLASGPILENGTVQHQYISAPHPSELDLTGSQANANEGKSQVATAARDTQDSKQESDLNRQANESHHWPTE
jgi:hypothetical protein